MTVEMKQPEEAKEIESSSFNFESYKAEHVVTQLPVLDQARHIIEVTVIKPGPAQVKINDLQVVYSELALKNSLPLWEGAACFCNHFNKSVRNIVGVYFSPWYDNGVKAKLRFIDDAIYHLVASIMADRAKGLAVPDIGISADISIKGKPTDYTIEVEEITKVVSADIVFSPGAGGSFDRVLNAVRERIGFPEKSAIFQGEKRIGIPEPSLPTSPLKGEDKGGGDAKRIRDLQSSADKLRAQVKNQEEQLQRSRNDLKEAVDKYRQIILSHNPDIPGEMIQGETVAELDSSLERAKAIVERVKQHLEAQVPAGAPARTLDIESLSPIEKIKYGLTKRGR